MLERREEILFGTPIHSQVAIQFGSKLAQELRLDTRREGFILFLDPGWMLDEADSHHAARNAVERTLGIAWILASQGEQQHEEQDALDR